MKKFEKVTERDWTAYFKGNLARRIEIDWEQGVHLESNHRKALIASLQRFQVGESGEGLHLKKCAAATNDPDYSRAIALFIDEEGYHAAMLAKILESQGAPLLEGHWSDAAFILIRRFSGLEMELMILLLAELVAKRYYRVLRDSTADPNIRAMCRQILRDENAHVAFHCDTLSRGFTRLSPAKRALIRFAWRRFYVCVCAVVALDHRGVLRAAGVSYREWMRGTQAVFNMAEKQIFRAKSPKRLKSKMQVEGDYFARQI